MGNFRQQWSSFGIREDTILKIKGLELIGQKEEVEYPIWKAHAFDDTVFRVSIIIHTFFFNFYIIYISRN